MTTLQHSTLLIQDSKPTKKAKLYSHAHSIPKRIYSIKIQNIPGIDFENNGKLN